MDIYTQFICGVHWSSSLSTNTIEIAISRMISPTISKIIALSEVRGLITHRYAIYATWTTRTKLRLMKYEVDLRVSTNMATSSLRSGHTKL